MYYARVLQSQGKTAEALQVLSAALERSPDVKTLRITYARLLVDAKRYEEAREQFGQLVSSDTDNADIRYGLALLLLQTNHPEDARTHLQHLVEQGKRTHAAHYYLGQIAETQKDIEAAMAAYRQVDRGQHALNAQVRVAVLLAQQDKIPEARQHLHALSRRNAQESVRLFLAEAEILTDATDLEGAMGIYDLALRDHPGNSDLLYARAMLAAKLDNLEVLERDLREILANEPNNADALNALGYTLADQTDRYEEALELVQKALQLKPDNYYILDSMGWVLYRLGRIPEAIDHLRRALAIQHDPEVAAHLGEVLWVAGEREAAQEVWNAALESTPDDKRLLDVIKRFSN